MKEDSGCMYVYWAGDMRWTRPVLVTPDLHKKGLLISGILIGLRSK